MDRTHKKYFEKAGEGMQSGWKPLFWKAGLVSNALALGVMVCLAFSGKADLVRWLSFAAGVGVSALALVCLYKAIGAAPQQSAVITWYLLRLVCEFGAVLGAMLLPFADALGVLIPQLFPIFVLAAMLALKKEGP